MTNRNTPILAAALLLLTGLYLLFAFSEGDRNSRRLALPETAERIEITTPAGEYALSRQGEVWILEPIGEPAEEELVSELLDSLTGEQRLPVASASGAGGFGLAGEEAVTLRYGEVEVRLGSPSASGRQVYMGLSGEQEVYLIDRRVREIAEGGEAALRDEVVARITESRIAEVTLASGGQQIRVSRRAQQPAAEATFENDVERVDATWQASDSEIEPFQLENFFQELRTLRVNGFADPAGPLDEAARITITFEDGESRVITLLSRGEDGYQLTGEGLPEDAVIRSWRARRLTLGRVGG